MPEDHVHHAPLIDQSEPPRPRAVRARHAASIIVLRPRGDDPEMLMGMRGAKHRFMPNRLVFPGGAVDRADLSAPCATDLPPHTLRHLRKGPMSVSRTAWHRGGARTGGGDRLSVGAPAAAGRLHLCAR